jgi:hypothetical protein
MDAGCLGEALNWKARARARTRVHPRFGFPSSVQASLYPQHPPAIWTVTVVCIGTCTRAKRESCFVGLMA